MVTFNTDVATLPIPTQPDLNYTLTYILRGTASSPSAPVTYGYDKGYDKVLIKAFDINGYAISSLNGTVEVEWQLVR